MRDSKISRISIRCSNYRTKSFKFPKVSPLPARAVVLKLAASARRSRTCKSKVPYNSRKNRHLFRKSKRRKKKSRCARRDLDLNKIKSSQ